MSIKDEEEKKKRTSSLLKDKSFDIIVEFVSIFQSN